MAFLRATTYGALLCFIAGCASSGADLNPAPSANEAPSNEQAVVRNVDGARMKVQTGAWPGDEGVTRDVTPLRVTIRNGGDNPMTLRYSNFSLLAPDGHRYSVIPPFQVEGSVDAAEMNTGYGTFTNPGFTYSGFGLSPYYSAAYDGIGVYNNYAYGPADYGYYNTYGDYWDNIELPTRTMLNRALPEGVIEPGGMVEGFLYFEKVDGDEVRKES